MTDVVHLWPPFHQAIEAMLADPQGRKLGLTVVSGYRSNELQAVLYAAALKKYGSAHEASKWVAPPGKSNHGPRVNDAGQPDPNGPWGKAVDLGLPGIPAVAGKWPVKKRDAVRALGKRYHVHQAMEYEDWHYEPDANLAHYYPMTHPPTQEDPVRFGPIIDQKTPDMPDGRKPHWTADEHGNLQAWNGARDLHSLDHFTTSHAPIMGMTADPSGDGVVLVAGDGMLDPQGRWVQSTYKILVGMK